MAFGQPSGPPASSRDVQELLRLLQEAGHRDFRDARGPMGFNQRQAAGKFTRDEVAAFVEQLQSATEPVEGEESAPPPREVVRSSSANPATGGTGTPSAKAPSTSATDALRRIPSEILAAELQRRGWVVMEP
jgi:hypothetical protein